MNIILANVGTVVAFRSGSPVDEKLILPLFSPYVSEGEIANLPAYNYYIRIAAIEAQEPMSGQTVVLDEATHNYTDRVIESSRHMYGKTSVQRSPAKNKAAAKKINSSHGKKNLVLPNKKLI